MCKSSNVDFPFRYSSSEKEIKDGLESELSSLSAQRLDSGLYECIASNLYGSAQMNTQVLIEE